jgi:hypothetical protein
MAMMTIAEKIAEAERHGWPEGWWVPLVSLQLAKRGVVALERIAAALEQANRS